MCVGFTTQMPDSLTKRAAERQQRRVEVAVGEKARGHAGPKQNVAHVSPAVVRVRVACETRANVFIGGDVSKDEGRVVAGER